MGMFFREGDVKQLLDGVFPGTEFTFHSAVLIESRFLAQHFALGINEENLYLVAFKPWRMKPGDSRVIPISEITEVSRDLHMVGYGGRIRTRKGEDIVFQSLKAIGYDMPAATERVIDYLSELKNCASGAREVNAETIR